MKLRRCIPYSIRERAGLLILVATLGAFAVISASKEPQPWTMPAIKAATWLTSAHSEYKSKDFWAKQKEAEPEAYAAALVLCQSADSAEYINCPVLRKAGKP